MAEINASSAFRCPNCGDAFAELAAPCSREAPTGTPGPQPCAGKYFAISAEMFDPASTDRWVGRKLNDKILLGPLLGKGGMGSVYQGWQLGLMKRQVAVKMLYTGSGVDKTARDRFVREAHANAMLRHEHIVQVFDADEAAHWDPPMPFIVMEIVENSETLKDRIRTWRLRPPPLSEVATVFDELLDALAYAHKKKIVHRDIKPANIMIQRSSDGLESLKVLDFGLARSFGASDDEALASVSGSKDSVLGTIAYMAPEQAMGEPVDGRADVYAVGSILFELLVGVRPFLRLGLNDLQMLVAKSQMDPVSPEGGMPPGGMERLGKLGEVLVGMMRRKPEERWDALTSRTRLAAAFAQSDVDLPLSSVALVGDLQTVDAARPTLSLAGALADSAAREAGALPGAVPTDHNAETVALSASETSATLAGLSRAIGPPVLIEPAPASSGSGGKWVALALGAAGLVAAGIFLRPAAKEAVPPVALPAAVVAAATLPTPAAPVPVVAPAVPAPQAAAPAPQGAAPAPQAPTPPPAHAAVRGAAPEPAAVAKPPAAPEAAAAPTVAAPPPPVAKAEPVVASKTAEPAPSPAASKDPPEKTDTAHHAVEKAPAASKPAVAVAAPAPAPPPAPAVPAAAAPAAAPEGLDAFKVDGAFIQHKHVSKEGKAAYLTWQRTASANEMSADAADAYCDKLAIGGYANWRLPTAAELRWTNTGNATDIHAFPGSAAGVFWAAGKSAPVLVGIRANAGEAQTGHVRCVQ